MPEKQTIERARQDQREGKAASTQAGEFVKEEMHHIRQGKHGAKSTKQAIAIGLSKARRAGVDLPPPEKGKTSPRTRKSAQRDFGRGQSESSRRKTSPRRSRAIKNVLKGEGHEAASSKALSKQAHSAARNRSAADRSEAAKKAARTKGEEGRSRAAKKAARTRMAHHS